MNLETSNLSRQEIQDGSGRCLWRWMKTMSVGGLFQDLWSIPASFEQFTVEECRLDLRMKKNNIMEMIKNDPT